MAENYIKNDEQYTFQVIITDKNGISDPDVNSKMTKMFEEFIKTLEKQQIK